MNHKLFYDYRFRATYLQYFYPNPSNWYNMLSLSNIINLSTNGVVTCPPLGSIENGVVNTGGFSPGSFATYTCNDGYVLVGDSTRTCQATGIWSGQEPQCATSSTPTPVTTSPTPPPGMKWSLSSTHLIS